ncbi:MAG: 5'-methylthioadenosine/adenosylhomocysteine nucleosidase [Clostridia bacterium]
MKTFCIIGAMDCEIKTLVKLYSAVTVSDNIYIANYNGKKIVIAKCGVGKVNAAALTQKIICTYSPEIIINTGAAGAIDSKVRIGDVIIAKTLSYHDFNPLELLDRYPPFSTKFSCDDTLIALARKSCEIHKYPFKIGVIVSGDCFVSSDSIKKDIFLRFGALCTEMEGASIAHVCILNKVKFAVVRSVSDFADSNAEIDINNFEETAALRAAEITDYIINNA